MSKNEQICTLAARLLLLYIARQHPHQDSPLSSPGSTTRTNALGLAGIGVLGAQLGEPRNATELPTVVPF